MTQAERRTRNKKIDIIPVECYELRDFKGKPNLITPAGYYDRVVNVLKDAGIDTSLKDYRPLKTLATNWKEVDKYDLRYKQRETLEKVVESERGYVCWPTGTGKSFLVGMICKLFPKAKIVITTRHLDPLNDIYNNLCGSIPSVGIYSSKKKSTGHRVMCFSAGSLHRADVEGVDLLIADEVHELATDKMLAVFAQFRFNKMLGLSANYQDRFDGADFELEGVFGPLIANLTYEEGVKHGMIVPIDVTWRDMRMDRNPCQGMEGFPATRHGIWRNNWRNAKIAEDAREYPEEQVLITVATVEHAVHLKKCLPEFQLCYSKLDDKDRDRYIRQGLISEDEPDMTYQRRNALKASFERGDLKKVIATTVWNRGVNFKKLQVLIRADASSSAIADTQIPGRLSRTIEGKDHGILIDYLDQFDGRFERKAKKRMQDYQSKGWNQILPSGS
jgi:superfamily II DNA or RNA helicase